MNCKFILYDKAYYYLRDLINDFDERSEGIQKGLLDSLLVRCGVPMEERQEILKTWDGRYVTFGMKVWEVTQALEVNECLVVNDAFIIVRTS